MTHRPIPSIFDDDVPKCLQIISPTMIAAELSHRMTHQRNKESLLNTGNEASRVSGNTKNLYHEIRGKN